MKYFLLLCHQQSQTSTTVNIPAPPPPPPPPPLNTLPLASTNTVTSAPVLSIPTPVVPDTRNALMDSIRKGTTLRKVDPAALSTGSGGGGDARNDLLSEIRQGIELKPAADREISGQRDSGNRGTDALADALRRALQERSRVIHSSDEEDDTSDNDEWDD